ncbi:zinc dependent phospholipase C family protein [Anaerolentibacter hominis]|uniref:zinc dependent phospholipase C family protein n=1 Tax=Anaerolentibacter hominis TaxID=3079009 RepID=UPI0031B803F0
MPGFTTHYLFGTSCFARMPESTLKSQIARHKHVYSFGEQGPDFFFFYLPSHLSRAPIGTLMHEENAGRFFRSMLRFAESLPDREDQAIAYSYLAGFLGHYCLDCACHPYIYSRTGYDPDGVKEKGYLGKHVDMETDIGTLLLKMKKGRLSSRFRQAGTIRMTHREKQIVAQMLSYSIACAYHRRISYPLMYLALTFLPLGVHVLHDPSSRKRKAFSAVEKKLLGFEFVSPQIAADRESDEHNVLNLCYEYWEHPWKKGEWSSASFTDLYEKAGKDYNRIFMAMADFVEQPGEQSWRKAVKEMGNRSYHSGL